MIEGAVGTTMTGEKLSANEKVQYMVIGAISTAVDAFTFGTATAATQGTKTAVKIGTTLGKIAIKDVGLDDLLGLSNMNMSYLIKQTGKSADEINEILKNKKINLKDINLSNINGIIKEASEAGRANYLDSLDDFVKGNKNFDDVLDDYAKAYANSIDSNKPWTWKDIPGGNNLSAKQKALVKQKAIELGAIPNIPVKPGTNHPDFKSADVIYKVEGKPVIEQLPKEKWLVSDKDQFTYLDSLLPGGKCPPGYTWHHSEISGQMELVPFGIHNSTWHQGGRAPGGWADAKR